MISLKSIDKLALAAMLSAIVAIPLASHASSLPGRTPDATVKRALSDDVFYTIRQGMQASDVLALIGPPHQKTRFPATKTTAWDYHYRDTWGYDADFSVVVDDSGTVVGTVRIRTGNG